MATPAETKKLILDLSKPGDEKIVVIRSRCAYCRRKTEVVGKFGMCQVCIAIRLAGDNIEVITPPGYTARPELDECPMCLETIFAGHLVLSCHLCPGRFHSECATAWNARSGGKECPTCRNPW